MWPRRRYAVVFLLGIGLLSAFLGASGQDQRLPWPPRPVQPPDTPITLDTPPPVAKKPNKAVKSDVPAPLVMVDKNPIVLVTAQVPAPTTSVPDVPLSLPDPPPPAPPPLIPSPTPPEQLPAKVTNQEPKGPEIPVSGQAPVVILPEPGRKPDVLPPDLPIPKPTIPDVLPSNTPKGPSAVPMPIPINEGPKLMQGNPPPKTISITPTFPSPGVAPPKDVVPEPTRPPSFRVVAPIRRAPVVTPDPPTLSPPSVPRETFAPPRPGFEERLPLLGVQTPVLTFEKKGPTTVQVNQSARFEIVVRNAGSVPAQKVQVEDELPAGARFLGADPQPVLRGDRVTWILDSLAPGAERRLLLDLQATAAAADWATNTTVTTSATKFARTSIARPALTLSMRGPAGAAVGQPVVFEIEMANNASYPLTGLVLQASIPPGLAHPLGDRIEADISDLPVLTSKTFPLATTAAKPGRHVITIKIVTRDGKEATAQAVVHISEAGVGARSPGTSRPVPDREGKRYRATKAHLSTR